MKKLVRITTVPVSLEKLLEGQLNFMQKEYEVIAVSSDKMRLKKLGEKIGVKTFAVEMTREITPQKDLMAVWRLYKFFKRTKPTIVHSHTPKAGIAGMLAAKLAGVPLRLHTVAGLPLLEASGSKRVMLKMVEKITFACATKVYPNSVKIYQYLLKNRYTSKKKLKVIGRGSSNGIDTEYFNPFLFSEEERSRFRESSGVSEEDFVFVFVGRMVRDKGVNELVEVFTRLNNKFPETALLLVGPFEDDLDPLKKSTMHQIDHNSKIIKTGFQDDVRPFLASADALVFPSYREGFPNAVLQAGAMGLPSIVTDINGCNEIVREGINGVIIPVRNEEALFLAMKNMLLNERERKSMAAKSREIIKSNFSRQEIWDALLAEYKQVEREMK